MVETPFLEFRHRADRADCATLMRVKIVLQTDSEQRQTAGTASNSDRTDFNLFAGLPPPQRRGVQLFVVKVCDEDQGKQSECPCWSGSSCERSTPASVSLRNAFSLSMVDRQNTKLLVKPSAMFRRISLQSLSTIMASSAAAEEVQKTATALDKDGLHSPATASIVGSFSSLKGMI